MSADLHMRPTTVEDLKNSLSELESRRDAAIRQVAKEYDDNIQAIKKLLSSCGKATPQNVEQSSTAHTTYSKEKSIKSAVLRMLRENRGKRFRAPEIAEYLRERGFESSSKTFVQSVSIAATRLVQTDTSIIKESEKTPTGVVMAYFQMKDFREETS